LVEMNTSDQILSAAMELFSEKGFAAVTTKEIAAKAQVSEVTLFRYFETKKMLYSKVFEKYIFEPFEPSLDEVFHDQILWDLTKDLFNFASHFQDIIIKNFKLLQMSAKDSNVLFNSEHYNNFIQKFPQIARKGLGSYFSVMKDKGLVTGDPEVLAINFMVINAGLILSLFFTDCDIIENHEKNLKNMLDIFIKGIKA
jgi:TetR/AcrR family transcriptional repressor of mexJK operon